MWVLNSIKYKYDRQTSDDLKANGFVSRKNLQYI